MLGPHDREKAKLVPVRLAPELLDDGVVLVAREVMRLQDSGVQLRSFVQVMRHSKSLRPSSVPSSGS